MRRIASWGCVPLFAVAASLAISNSAAATDGGEQKPRFRSWTALRTKDVVLQRLDFSCGAASLATLATFFLGRPTTEEEALRIVRGRYTPEEWKKKKQDGLSMEDLAFMAGQLGFEAQGGRLGLASLLQLNGPVIIHLNKGEFQHFTVLRGIHGMTVYLADPALGTVAMSLSSFVDQFTGAVLAVWDPAKPIAAEHILKLKEQDKIYDRIFDTVRPTLYDRVRPLGPHF
jgi:predicted double-glycine peptidase